MPNIPTCPRCGRERRFSHVHCGQCELDQVRGGLESFWTPLKATWHLMWIAVFVVILVLGILA